MNGHQLVALVTGGNRGLGLAVCAGLARRGHRVLLGSRDPDRGRAAVAKLRAQSIAATPIEIDVASEPSVAAAAAAIATGVGRLDVLVNNAGVLLDDDVDDPLGLHDGTLERTLAVNLLGPLRTCRAFLPGMLDRGYGRVVNVSARCGLPREVQQGGGCPAAYRVSKAALNAATQLFADRQGHDDIKINAVSPGWIDTDMGRATGDPTRTAEQGAETVIWLATLPADGPSGGFFAEDGRIAW